MIVWSFIPARKGSKGVPGKNIKELCGWPLIAYSVVASQLSKHITRTIVSTDCDYIGKVAETYGAEVPFLRPAQFATDEATDLMWVQHALEWFENEELELPDLIVHLRPTTPLRDPAVIDAAIDKMIEGGFNTLRSVEELTESPYKMYRKNGDYLAPLMNDHYCLYGDLEACNNPRQSFPKALSANGYVDILKPAFIKSSGKLHGNEIYGFETNKTVEIDTDKDFKEAELYVKETPIYSHLEKLF